MLRLSVAFVLGSIISWMYKKTTVTSELGTSFPVTLMLLTVLIAMVTQVIGDNIALAFSLVGALSIVRFRTVVRDTRDMAWVIFAVVVGMSAGNATLWVAIIGMVIIGGASFFISSKSTFKNSPSNGDEESQIYTLNLIMPLESNFETVAGKIIDAYCNSRRLKTVTSNTNLGHMSYTYKTNMTKDKSPTEFVQALRELDDVIDVSLDHRYRDQSRS